MTKRMTPWVGVIAMAALLGMPAVASSQTGTSALPRTPWGDPDLQGVWNNNTVVPLERPANLAGKDTLTDEEVAERFQRTSDALFTPREGNTADEQQALEAAARVSRQRQEAGHPGVREPAVPFVPAK